MELVIPYTPREVFIPYHDRKQRFAVIVAHRRAGKTVSCICDLIIRALCCDKVEPRFAYLAPYHAQAKDIAWTYLQRFSSVIPGVQYNVSELRVDFPNGARIRLYGAENAERMRGLYFDGIVIDEPADINPRVWPEIVRPALSDRQGWATFIGTPKGHNSFYDTYTKAEGNADWFRLLLRASETGLIPAHELEAARRELSDEQYRQEYESSFEAAIIGSYFGKELEALERAGQIKDVPHEAALPVHVFFDLGYNDATAMWFVQLEPMGMARILRYEENSGQSMAFYADRIKTLKAERNWVLGRVILPHDAEINNVATGTNVASVMRQFGFDIEVLKRTNDLLGDIQAVRSFLPRCWFNKEETKHGVECLKQYRRVWNDERKVFLEKPLHDWTSHAADAFRYLATYQATNIAMGEVALDIDTQWIV